MGYVKFNNSTDFFEANVIGVSVNSITLAFPGLTDPVENTNGFVYSETEDGDVLGDYSDYIYIKSKLNNTIVYSNNTTPPHPETLEEAIAAKVAELNQIQQDTIAYGVTVTLYDGTEERFTLTTHDQLSLNSLYTRVVAGDSSIPWHSSNQGDGCKFYSNANMRRIVEAALAFVTYHVTFFRDLRIYVRSLTDIDTVKSVRYDLADLPREFYSDVLKELVGFV